SPAISDAFFISRGVFSTRGQPSRCDMSLKFSRACWMLPRSVNMLTARHELAFHTYEYVPNISGECQAWACHGRHAPLSRALGGDSWWRAAQSRPKPARIRSTPGLGGRDSRPYSWAPRLLSRTVRGSGSFERWGGALVSDCGRRPFRCTSALSR